jgi:hypothetical protein
MPERIKNIITPKVEVKWSNLIKPDTMFGEGSANHNITVVLTPELEQTLTALAKENGAKKINGTYEKDGIKTIKFKSKTYVEKGPFPCQDSTGAYTSVVPFGGDVVRVKLAPALITKGTSKSMSFYLNGVQIVAKNTDGPTKRVNGFDAVEGGYVGEHVDAPVINNKSEATAQSSPAITDSDIPF